MLEAKETHEPHDGDGMGSPGRQIKRQRVQPTPVDAHVEEASSELLRRRGYVVVPSFLTEDELVVLRNESEQLFASLHEDAPTAIQKLIDNGCVLDTMADCPMKETAHARVDQAAFLEARTRQLERLCGSHGASKDGSKTFERLVFQRLPHLITSLIEKENDRELFFFNEHYVVKPPHTNVEFRWHRDDDQQLAMCVHRDEIMPYVSAWCALDDVTHNNGPLRFVGLNKLLESDEASSVDLEALASEPLRVAAGTVVLFFSHVWHSSSSNASSTTRRAFYAQYSRHPITATPRDEAPLSFAIPCLSNSTT